jgi:hypothetical protein
MSDGKSNVIYLHRPVQGELNGVGIASGQMAEVSYLPATQDSNISRFSSILECWRNRRTENKYVLRRRVAALALVSAAVIAADVVLGDDSGKIIDREEIARCTSDLEAFTQTPGVKADDFLASGQRASVIADACINSNNDPEVAREMLLEQSP